MTQLTADFEKGTNGNTIATTDAGSANAWDVVILTSGTLAYDNTHAAHGILAGKVATGATSTSTYLAWTTSLGGTLTDHYGRLYVYLTANPGNTLIVANSLLAGSSGAQLFIAATGKIGCKNSAGTTLGQSANVVALNAWNRIEYHLVHGAGAVGTFEAKLFTSPDGSTPTETITFTNVDVKTGADQMRFGVAQALANAGPFWLDNIVAGATSYPGPAVAAASSGYPKVLGYYTA